MASFIAHYWQRPLQCLSLFILILSQVTYAQNIPLIQKYCSSQNTGSDNQPSYSNYMSLGYCQTACQGEYAFAVLNYKTCWCSNYVPFDQQDVYDCSSNCPGFPSENCGGGPSSDLYGYVALRLAPSGTMGSPSAPPDTETKTIILTPSPSTVYLTSVNTIVTTEAPSTVTGTPSSVTSSVVVTHVVTSVVGASPGFSSATASASPAPAPAPIIEQHNGISGGAVAGIVIGILAAVAIAFSLLYCLCWRRRHGSDGGSRSGLGRNASVLSKVGLLRNQNSARPPPYGDEGSGTYAGSMSQRRTAPSQPPRINTQLPEFASYNDAVPSSAHTGGTSDSRRGSKPLFVDQRLNPHVLTAHHNNASRSSIGTLEDNQDYSRRLEVKNPDPT